MTSEELEAMKEAWRLYPTQDNEGFQPDRGGFKCGWFAALNWCDDERREANNNLKHESSKSSVHRKARLCRSKQGQHQKGHGPAEDPADRRHVVFFLYTG